MIKEKQREIDNIDPIEFLGGNSYKEKINENFTNIFITQQNISHCLEGIKDQIHMFAVSLASIDTETRSEIKKLEKVVKQSLSKQKRLIGNLKMLKRIATITIGTLAGLSLFTSRIEVYDFFKKVIELIQ